MARTLGVDYGTRRIGLACSDEAGLIAMPLAILPCEGGLAAVVAAIGRVCDEKQVADIVIGMPLNMDGSRGPAAEAAQRMADALAAGTGRPVKTWDERWSSRQAERMLIDADVSRRRRRGLVDQVAAQYILQSYLDAHAIPTTPGVPEPDPL